MLARIRLPAIRNRAHQLIADGHPDLGARLLQSSYGDGDVALLITLLEQAADEDRYHRIGHSALNVIERMNEKPREAAAIHCTFMRMARVPTADRELLRNSPP